MRLNKSHLQVIGVLNGSYPSSILFKKNDKFRRRLQRINIAIEQLKRAGIITVDSNSMLILIKK